MHAYNTDGLSSREEPWFSLWSALCHQSDVYTASYAATPHVAEIAAGKSERQRLEHLLFIGSVEAYRHRKSAPSIPADLERDYFASLELSANLVLDCLKMQWDEMEYKILLGALAIVRGRPASEMPSSNCLKKSLARYAEHLCLLWAMTWMTLTHQMWASGMSRSRLR